MITTFRSMSTFSRSRKVSTFFLLFLLLAQASRSPAGRRSEQREPRAAAVAARGRPGPRQDLPRDRDAPGQASTAATTKSRKKAARSSRTCPHDAFVAELTGAELAELGQDDGVKFVAPDAPIVFTGTVDKSKLATQYPAATNASQLWGATTPITGKGIGVAVLDTGIATSLRDFNTAGTATPAASSPRPKFNCEHQRA